MKYQKIKKLLDGTTNQPSKFRTRNWVQINDESKGKYDNSNIRFKRSMTRSSLYHYSDAYILVKGIITVSDMPASGAVIDDTNKTITFKNCDPFTYCITEKNNRQVDDAEYIDIVMSMYNLKKT